jgi:hypothetical protein
MQAHFETCLCQRWQGRLISQVLAPEDRASESRPARPVPGERIMPNEEEMAFMCQSFIAVVQCSPEEAAAELTKANWDLQAALKVASFLRALVQSGVDCFLLSDTCMLVLT